MGRLWVLKPIAHAHVGATSKRYVGVLDIRASASGREHLGWDGRCEQFCLLAQGVRALRRRRQLHSASPARGSIEPWELVAGVSAIVAVFWRPRRTFPSAGLGSRKRMNAACQLESGESAVSNHLRPQSLLQVRDVPTEPTPRSKPVPDSIM